MKTGMSLPLPSPLVYKKDTEANNCDSLNFNIVCKRIGANRMSYYLNEAANDLRDLLMPDLAAQPEKAKL